MISIGVVTVFAAALVLGALSRSRPLISTKTSTSTVYTTAQSSTAVPAACLQAISLTRQLEKTAQPTAIPKLSRRFDVAAGSCQIVPPECVQALTYFSQIVATQIRAKLLALSRAFEAAAGRCG